MRNTITKLLFMVFFCASAQLSAQQFGVASYYSDTFHGRKTASGELYNKNSLTGAHKTLPFGTVVRVTRVDNNQSVEIRINDRGPGVKGRIVDVSRAAAEALGIVQTGTASVKLDVLGQKAIAPIVSRTKPVEVEEYVAPKSIKPVVKEAVKEAIKETTVVNAKPAVKATPKPAPKVAAPKVATPEPRKTVSTTTAKRVKAKDYKNFDLYKVQILRPERKGFGVQVATFTQYENVMKQVAELQEKWFNNILVSVEEGKDKKPMYKILLGPFPDRKIAKSYEKELKKKKNINGFIVDLQEIKY